MTRNATTIVTRTPRAKPFTYTSKTNYSVYMTAKAQFPSEQADDGSFVRQEDHFRSWVSADGHTGFPVAAGRYQLFVSLACPWAHRTIITRKLMGLEAAIPMTVVDPIRDDRG